MNAQDLEQRARELLAAGWKRAGQHMTAAMVMNGHSGESTRVAIGAISDALRQQPAPVDLGQFREAICSWREDSLRKSETYVTYTSRTVMAKRVTEADRLLSIIDNAGKVECAEVSGYIATVPDKCDRIIWRGQYHHLPLHQPAPVVDDALADTQRAIIEAAERRGYERAMAEARAQGVQS